jgi:primase-polymerase (primpol)-like protein
MGYCRDLREISPSGDGVHFLARGKLNKSIVRDDLGFEPTSTAGTSR